MIRGSLGEEAVQKVENADPSGLKPLGMTRKKDLVGTAQAVPFQICLCELGERYFAAMAFTRALSRAL